MYQNNKENNKSKLILSEEPLIKHPQSKKIKNNYFEFFLTLHFFLIFSSFLTLMKLYLTNR